MLGEFLNIVFRSIKLDKTLYSDNRNFGEASIYFAGLIMILDGMAGAVAANTIMKTAIGMSGLTAILTWLVWGLFIYVIGVKLFPDKQTSKVPFKKVLTAVGFITSPWWHPEKKTNIAMGYVPFDGTLNANGFPKGKVGTKYKVHLPEKYSDTPGKPVDAVIVDIPFKESFNANTREVSKG